MIWYYHFVGGVKLHTAFPSWFPGLQVPEETIRELGMEVIDGSLKHEVKDEGKVRNLKVRSLRLDFPTGVKMINAKLPDLRALSCEELFQQHNIKAKDEAQKQEV